MVTMGPIKGHVCCLNMKTNEDFSLILNYLFTYEVKTLFLNVITINDYIVIFFSYFSSILMYLVNFNDLVLLGRP